MNLRWKRLAVCSLLVIALVATLGVVGCGDDNGNGKKKKILIGNMTDLTGVAAPALAPMSAGLHDMVAEINAGEAPGPKLPEGVELEVIDYDTAFNSSRFIPGYEWLKGRGCQVIVSVFNDCSEAIKVSANKDKIAVLGQATTIPMVEPPGYVFGYSVPTRWAIKLVLEWIGEQWIADGKPGKPVIATVGWNDAWGKDNAQGAEEYCAAHSDKFDYKGTYLAPVGTGMWSAEVAQTMGVDYVQTCANGATMPASYIGQYRNAGGTAITFDSESVSAYAGYVVDTIGWDAVNGHINCQTWGWWGLTQWPEVEYVRHVLEKYHPKEAAEWIHAGMGYMGGAAMQLFGLQTIVSALNAVGVDNFTGETYYNHALTYSAEWAGDPRGFTADSRVVTNDMIILEWNANQEDLIMVSDGWLPVPHE